MKLVIFACLAAAALAAPQQGIDPVGIVLDERRDDGDGNFAYQFETEDGVHQNVVGRPIDAGGIEITGSYRFPLDDGRIAEVTYVANENGFQPESDLLPIAPEMPAHVLETLALIDELVRQGATWDDQGNRLTRKK